MDWNWLEEIANGWYGGSREAGEIVCVPLYFSVSGFFAGGVSVLDDDLGSFADIEFGRAVIGCVTCFSELAFHTL